MIKHIVFLQFKPEISTAEIDAMFLALDNLRKTIPEILSFSAGVNNSPEGLNKNMTHGFVMEFADEQARNKYLVHPDHVALAQNRIIPAVVDGTNSVVVLDYKI